jgi:hypothetical protein
MAAGVSLLASIWNRREFDRFAALAAVCGARFQE